MLELTKICGIVDYNVVLVEIPNPLCFPASQRTFNGALGCIMCILHYAVYKIHHDKETI